MKTCKTCADAIENGNHSDWYINEAIHELLDGQAFNGVSVTAPDGKCTYCQSTATREVNLK